MYLGNRKPLDYVVLSDFPDLVLVLGAESSATRLMAELIAAHPDAVGISKEAGHADLLDDVWQDLEMGGVTKTSEIQLQGFMNEKGTSRGERVALVTRRSMPHAPVPGTPAQPLQFPPLKEFFELSELLGLTVSCVVTVRSTYPNLLSWKEKRASARGNLNSAFRQYQESYRLIFDALPHNSKYCFVPNEALVLDGVETMKGVFSVIGLRPSPIKIGRKIKSPNTKYYKRLSRRATRLLNR